MVKTKKKRFSIGAFMSGASGERFFNIAYSIGAAIVILGALFKILHVKGGDTLLAIGMGTEVLMFILTAFERPYSDHHNTEGVSTVSGEGGTKVSKGEGNRNLPDDYEINVDPRPSVGDMVIGDGQMRDAINEDMKAMDESMQTYISQMHELNQNIAGLNTIYEIQLKNASSQLNAMEFAGKSLVEMQRMCEGTAERSQQFREESEKLTESMQKLNEVYENMLRAMNVPLTKNNQ